MLNPAGSSYRDIHASGSECANVFGGGVWRRKFDCDVDVIKGRGRESCAMQIILAVEFCAHFETIFRAKLLDEAAHLSVSDDGQAQGHKLAACATGCASC